MIINRCVTSRCRAHGVSVQYGASSPRLRLR
jgi:hypothetical protein